MSAGDTEEKFVRWKVDLVRKFFKANRGEEEVKKMIEESKGVGILSTTKSEGKVIDIAEIGYNAIKVELKVGPTAKVLSEVEILDFKFEKREEELMHKDNTIVELKERLVKERKEDEIDQVRSRGRATVAKVFFAAAKAAEEAAAAKAVEEAAAVKAAEEAAAAKEAEAAATKAAADFDLKHDYANPGSGEFSVTEQKLSSPGRADLVSQISLSSILALTWKRESESGIHYVRCVSRFLKSIAGSLHSVFMERGEIILKFNSSDSLSKALLEHATEEKREWKNLEPRARVVSDLHGDFFLFIFYNHYSRLHSKQQLLQDVTSTGGHVDSSEDKMVIAKYSSLIDYVRALTGMLGLYHTLVIKQCHLELKVIGSSGEDLHL